MTDLWKIVGIGLCALCTVIIMRDVKREYVPLFAAAFSAAVLSAVLPKISAAADLAHHLANYAGSERIKTVLKALGIVYLTTAAADLCRSLGEGTIASSVETAGRAELLLLCIPLLRELVDLSLLS